MPGCEHQQDRKETRSRGGWRITHLESGVGYLKNYPVFQGPGGHRKLNKSTSKQTAMSFPSDVNRTLAAVPSER